MGGKIWNLQATQFIRAGPSLLERPRESMPSYRYIKIKRQLHVALSQERSKLRLRQYIKVSIVVVIVSRKNFVIGFLKHVHNGEETIEK